MSLWYGFKLSNRVGFVLIIYEARLLIGQEMWFILVNIAMIYYSMYDDKNISFSCIKYL
jgi:hypothetical protein